MYIYNEQKEKIMWYNTNNVNTTEHVVLNKKKGDTIFVISSEGERPVFIYSVSKLLEYLANNAWTFVMEYRVGRQDCIYKIQSICGYLYAPALLYTYGLYCKDDALVKIFNKYFAVDSKRLNTYIGVDYLDWNNWNGYINSTPDYVRFLIDSREHIGLQLTDAMDDGYTAEIIVDKNRKKIASMCTYINSDIIMNYCKTTLGLRL